MFTAKSFIKWLLPCLFVAPYSLLVAAPIPIYSNFNSSPVNLYNCCSGYALDGGGQRIGASFIPAVSNTLTRVNTAISHVASTDGVVISLWDDDGNGPGNIIEAWVFATLPTFGTCCTIQTMVPFGIVNLTAGQRYWLVAVANSADGNLAWNMNNIGANGTYAFGSGNIPDLIVTQGEMPAFEILGSEVPEPGTLLLSLAGLGLIGFARARRGRAGSQ